MAPRRKRADVSLVVTYRRVSTTEQGDLGAGLEAQDQKLTAEIANRGWTRVLDLHDVASGKSTDGRPGLAEALRMVSAGEAGTLMVTKLDRLGRSVSDFAPLLKEALKVGWNLVMLDPAVDLSNPSGKFLAHIMSSVAELEREMIGQRTSDALRALQANGTRLGRPSGLPVEVLRRVRHERGQGATYAAIADGLNADAVPTAQGGARWHPSSVRAVALSQDAAAIELEETLT